MTRSEQGIYTILRDKTSKRQEFIFYLDRLATYLIEKALEFVPAGHKIVTTPVGVEYDGRSINTVGAPIHCVFTNAKKGTIGGLRYHYLTIVSGYAMYQ